MGRKEVTKIAGDAGEDIVPTRIKWFMVIYMSIVHVLALVGLYKLVFDFSWTAMALFVATYWFSGIGITGAAHRLWAHRSYKAHPALRVFLMLGNSMANQGSIFHWSRDHRVHHRHSETASDPHDASRGMFFAHMGWLFVEKRRNVIEAGREVGMKDLLEDWVVMFQDRNKYWLMPLMCFILPASLSTWFGESYWRGLFIAGALRYVVVLHATWSVNSFAHWYGNRPYADINPAENTWVSLATGGEGWHNWHHVFPSDYSASEFGWAGQFNGTTLFIDTMALLGLVTDRKRSYAKGKRVKDVNDHVRGGVRVQQVSK